MVQEKPPTMLEQGLIYSSLNLFADAGEILDSFIVDNVVCPPGNWTKSTVWLIQ